MSRLFVEYNWGSQFLGSYLKFAFWRGGFISSANSNLEITVNPYPSPKASDPVCSSLLCEVLNNLHYLFCREVFKKSPFFITPEEAGTANETYTFPAFVVQLHWLPVLEIEIYVLTSTSQFCGCSLQVFLTSNWSGNCSAAANDFKEATIIAGKTHEVSLR